MEFQLAHPRARAGYEQGQLGTGQKTRDGWAALARGERSRGGRSLPTGVPGIGGRVLGLANAMASGWPPDPGNSVFAGELCPVAEGVRNNTARRRLAIQSLCQLLPLASVQALELCRCWWRWRHCPREQGAEPQTESTRHRVQSTQARPSQRTRGPKTWGQPSRGAPPTVGHGASAAANDRRAMQASNCRPGMRRGAAPRRLT
jgi:hypothetical protein